MRETRIAQTSIFENYSKHEFGAQLRALSDRLDQHPEILLLVADDLIDASVAKVGRTGLTVENIFRCMLLKQQLRVSYEQLAFHLSDSMTYRTFARLSATEGVNLIWTVISKITSISRSQRLTALGS
jgi:IS5 family transposase